jgi:hypothetical protein
MSKSSKREIEAYYFERFRKLWPLPEGMVTFEDKPDVIIYGPRKVGIEITNFYLAPGSLLESEQQQEPLRKKVVERARKKYVSNGKNIEITFDFDKANPITSVGYRNYQINYLRSPT